MQYRRTRAGRFEADFEVDRDVPSAFGEVETSDGA
jgi:hypothetical protein